MKMQLKILEDGKMEFVRIEKKTRQQLLSRFRALYYEYFPISEYQGFRDWAQNTGLYKYIQLHPELIEQALSDGDLAKIMRCEWGRRRGY